MRWDVADFTNDHAKVLAGCQVHLEVEEIQLALRSSLFANSNFLQIIGSILLLLEVVIVELFLISLLVVAYLIQIHPILKFVGLTHHHYWNVVLLGQSTHYRRAHGRNHCSIAENVSSRQDHLGYLIHQKSCKIDQRVLALNSVFSQSLKDAPSAEFRG